MKYVIWFLTASVVALWGWLAIAPVQTKIYSIFPNGGYDNPHQLAATSYTTTDSCLTFYRRGTALLNGTPILSICAPAVVRLESEFQQ